MSVLLTWSAEKARANATKHGVTFEEAATVLLDPFELTDADPIHPERSVSVGVSDRRRLVVVVYTESQSTIRIISARLATRRERKSYEEAK